MITAVYKLPGSVLHNICLSNYLLVVTRLLKPQMAMLDHLFKFLSPSFVTELMKMQRHWSSTLSNV